MRQSVGFGPSVSNVGAHRMLNMVLGSLHGLSPWRSDRATGRNAALAETAMGSPTRGREWCCCCGVGRGRQPLGHERFRDGVRGSSGNEVMRVAQTSGLCAGHSHRLAAPSLDAVMPARECEVSAVLAKPPNSPASPLAPRQVARGWPSQCTSWSLTQPRGRTCHVRRMHSIGTNRSPVLARLAGWQWLVTAFFLVGPIQAGASGATRCPVSPAEAGLAFGVG